MSTLTHNFLTTAAEDCLAAKCLRMLGRDFFFVSSSSSLSDDDDSDEDESQNSPTLNLDSLLGGRKLRLFE